MFHKDVRLRAVRIRNYRGIKEMDAKFGPGGAKIVGRNRGGKSSFVKALRAGLEGIGIGPDAIRNGEDESEVLIDLGALIVQRTISKRSTDLEVTDPDGNVYPKGAAKLREVLGTYDLDPIEFYLADAKAKREMLMSAMPLQLTAEQINRWCETPGAEQKGLDKNGHELLAELRERYDKLRKTAKENLKKAKQSVDTMRPRVLDLKIQDEPATTPEQGKERERAIELQLSALRERLKSFKEREDGAAKTRQRIADLRRRAAEELQSDAITDRPKAKFIDAVKRDVESAKARVAELRKALAAAEEKEKEVSEYLKALQKRESDAADAEKNALSWNAEADGLEASVASMLGDQREEDIAAAIVTANEELAAAKAVTAMAERRAEDMKALREYNEAMAERSKIGTEVDKLERICTRLTKDAPAELSKSANLIPGMEITASKILVDGVDIDQRSSAEQMQFAVDLARRLAGRAHIIIVDDLEKLDPDEQPRFIRAAQQDGWQLVGAMVGKGDLTVIELEGEGGAQ